MFVSNNVEIFLNEEFIAKEILNEKFNLNSIKNITQKSLILATLFLSTIGSKPNLDLPSKQEIAETAIISSLANQKYISNEELEQKFEDLFVYLDLDNYIPINNNILKNSDSLKISKEGIHFIKHHEKLRLRAYDLGDGKITVGWGHTEPISVSTMEIGHRISKKEAEKFFYKDLRRAEDGVRRLFNLWKEQGIDVPVSQHMWDAMVSMAFNMGVNGLRGSNMVLDLKNKNYVKAAKKIPFTKINSKIFPGLKNRRESEKELFLTDLLI
jgi:lysozyme